MVKLGVRSRGRIAILLLLPLSMQSGASSGVFAEDDVTVLYSVSSGSPSDNFGFVAERIGDIDGDGAAEFIVGAPRDTAGGSIAGAIYVYSGRTGALLKKTQGQPFNRFGFSVAAAGDVDGDGIPDYMAGGPGALVGPVPTIGRVVLFSGATHDALREWRGAHHLDLFGFDINTAGDVDGDGRPDVVVGARMDGTVLSNAGRVSVFSSVTGAVLWTTTGATANAFLGAGVSGLADLSGDGVPEIAAGADGAGSNGGGEAYIWSGANGQLLRTLTPNGRSATLFGQFFVHDAGDVNRDGTPDIFVGDYADSPPARQFTGRAYVFSGNSDERLRMFTGEFTGDSLGGGRGCGDVDGDGFADLIVSSYLNSSGVTGGGRIYVFSGQNGQVLRTMTGTEANRRLGIDALAVGDVNGDGKTDLLVTGFRPTGAGIAHVVAGH